MNYTDGDVVGRVHGEGAIVAAGIQRYYRLALLMLQFNGAHLGLSCVTIPARDRSVGKGTLICDESLQGDQLRWL